MSSFEIKENISYKDTFKGIPSSNINIEFDGQKLFDDLKNEINNFFILI